MKLMSLDDTVLDELVQKGYSEFRLKSSVEPQEGGIYQHLPIQVYEARYNPEKAQEAKEKLVELKEHLHQHSADCYVVLKD